MNKNRSESFSDGVIAMESASGGRGSIHLRRTSSPPPEAKLILLSLIPCLKKNHEV
jgi:hypothetical protein